MPKFNNQSKRSQALLEQLASAVNDLNNDSKLLDADHKKILTVLNTSRVAQISALCEQIFIKDDGTLDDIIYRCSGASIFPLESDSYGWIRGGLITRKGTIAFG